MDDVQIEYTVRFDGPAELMPKPPVMARFAQELKKNMGEWALLGRCKAPNSARQRAYIIRTGEQAGYEPAGSFEAEARTIFGEYRVYARYVGPDA